jgi:hypothetical protein
MMLDFVGRRVAYRARISTIPSHSGALFGTQTYQVLSKPLVMAELCSFAKIGGIEPENGLRCDVKRKNYGRAALDPDALPALCGA